MDLDFGHKAIIQDGCSSANIWRVAIWLIFLLVNKQTWLSGESSRHVGDLHMGFQLWLSEGKPFSLEMAVIFFGFMADFGVYLRPTK